MEIRAAEISKVIKDQISNFGDQAQVSETGQVLSVGEGPKASTQPSDEQEEATKLPRARPYVTRGTTQRVATGGGHPQSSILMRGSRAM